MIRHNHTLFFVFTVAIVCIAACRAPMMGSAGGATLSFSLGGVLPPANKTALSTLDLARAVLPNSQTVRVTVTGEDGFSVSRSVSYIPGTPVSLYNLPIGIELSVEIATLDGSDSILTAWSGVTTLDAGLNSLSATLMPESDSVVWKSTVTCNTLATNAVTIESGMILPAGGVTFLAVPFDNSAPGEYQILYDTGKAEWAWMNAYDAAWRPLDVVCKDEGQGWVVVTVPAGGTTVYLGLANAVASPGYPTRSLSGLLQARKTRFCAPGASGTGTSLNPVDFDSTISNLSGGASVFLRNATFTIGTTVSPQYNLRVYGGFATNWQTRSGTSAITQAEVSSAQNTITWNGPGGLIDGVEISTPSHANNSSRLALNVLLTNSLSSLVVSNSRISGNRSAITISMILRTGGLVLGRGTMELSRCTVSAGRACETASSAGGASATGISVETNEGHLYLHDSDIDGGYAQSNASQADSVALSLGGQAASTVTMARARIWGGVAISGDGNASSRGLSITAGELVLANSMVSGGLAWTINGIGSVALGISCATGDVVAIGNTIDSGRALAQLAGTTNFAGVYKQNSGSNQSVLVANVVLSSSETTGNYGAALYESQDDTSPAGSFFNRVGGNLVIRIPDFWNLDGSRTSVPGFSGNRIVSASIGINAVVLSQCIIPSGADYPSYFAQWLAGNTWRVNSGYLDNVAGSETAGSDHLAAWENSHPALFLDLAGNPRPSSGLWTRGAYQ